MDLELPLRVSGCEYASYENSTISAADRLCARDLFGRAKGTAGTYQRASVLQKLARHEDSGKCLLVDEIPCSVTVRLA